MYTHQSLIPTHHLIMQEQGDLLSSELAEIWKAAPKFPQEDESAADKIDVDSFIQVYRDIDDLFEDDKQEGAAAAAAEESKKDAVTKSEEADVVDEELSQTFATLTTTQGADSITFSQLRQWEEITSLIEDEGILSDDELVSLWENAVGTKGKEGSMDVIKFVSFNNELDDLFEFDGEDNEDDADANLSDGEADEDTEEEIAQGAEEPVAAAAPAPLPIITEEDLPPGVLFSQLANENYLVGKVELQRWGELNGMLKEGDLTVDELNTLFDNAAKAPGTKDMLDEDGFCSLFEAIDNLFEDDDGDDEAASPAQAAVRELKEELLEYIEDMANLAEEEGLQICGLDSGDLEQERVLEIVSELEREPYNQVTAVTDMGGGAVDKMELVGTWDLLYSSSSTMKYNEGLSGLAGGLTRFGGLQQELSSTKYMSDVEYSEQVIGKLGGNAMEVKIKGDWDMRTEVSLFTGRPSNVMTVIPDKVVYGPRSDKADHWKSLGPMNLLVLTYLDEDIRIMRGNTSTDTLFIWSRAK